MANYPLISGSLASNCWPADPQTLYNEMFSKGFVQLSLEGSIIQETAPGTTDRDKIWWQIDGSGHVVGWWKYSGGSWRRPYDPTGVIDTFERRLYMGSEASLQTYDGGTAVAVTDTTGPFWEVDHDFDGYTFAAPGTIPGTSDVLTVGTNFGSATGTLVAGNLPTGSLGFTLSAPLNLKLTFHPGFAVQEAGGDSNPSYSFNGSAPTFQNTFTATIDDAASDPYPVVQPVRGIFIIRRTNRMWRTP